MTALPDGRGTRAGLAFARIVLGLLWLTQVVWKMPPDFKLLTRFTSYAVEYEVFPPWAFIVEKVILPNMTLFGYVTLVMEASIAAFLILGLATRLWALIGLSMTIPIMLSSLNAPHEWSWAYYMMFTLHVVVLATAAGRAGGLDGLLRPAWQAGRGRLSRLLVVAS